MRIFLTSRVAFPDGPRARARLWGRSSSTPTTASLPRDITEHQQGRPTALTTDASLKTTTASEYSMPRSTPSLLPMGYEEDDYTSTMREATLRELLARAENARKSSQQQELSGSQAGSKTVLQEANDAVFGPRQHYYGHPRENYKRISDLWSVIVGTTITPEQTGLMMIALKISRLMETPGHRDSYVDIAGYAEATARAVGLDD